MSSISEKEREVVIARLDASTPGVTLYSGANAQSFNKEQLIELIKSKDPVGDEYVKIDLDFMRALKNGELMNQLISA